MMSRSRLWVFAFVLATSAAPIAPQAQSLAFIHAPGDSTHGRHRAAHLLDHKPTTSWCQPSGQRLGARLEFKGPQKVDRIILVAADDIGRRAVSVRLSDGQHSVVVDVPEHSSSIDLHLSKALLGTTYTLTVERTGAAQGPLPQLDAACLAELTLYEKEHEVTVLAAENGLVGGWNAGPIGGSEGQLTFASDGTWKFLRQPLAGGPNVTLSGTYGIKNRKLWMRKGLRGGVMYVTCKRKRITIDPSEMGAPAADYDQLTLGGELLPELQGSYDNAYFR